MKSELKPDRLAFSCCMIALIFILLAMLGWLAVGKAASLCGITMTMFLSMAKMRQG